MVSLIIDGRKIEAHPGTSVLRAALDNGIYISNLCHIQDASPAASCRLCFVEIEGHSRPVTACTEPVKEGMTVNTRGESALRLARRGFELLMSAHQTDCAVCPANRRCELQKIAAHLRVKLKTDRLRRLVRDKPVDDTSPLFTYNPDKCVLCGRCVYVCRRRAGNGAGGIGFVRRGFERTVSTFGGEPLGRSACSGCGECVRVCPAGALTPKKDSTCSQSPNAFLHEQG